LRGSSFLKFQERFEFCLFALAGFLSAGFCQQLGSTVLPSRRLRVLPKSDLALGGKTLQAAFETADAARQQSDELAV
jgi:hypothetical protein